MKTVVLKSKYEAPLTNRVVVEMESDICAASVNVNPGDDIGKDRHISVNEQEYSSIDFTQPGQDNWD